MGRLFAHRYRVESQLGEGATSVVYAALDLKTDERVAIKVLSPSVADDAIALLRFRREAQIVSKLRHHHICRSFEFANDEGAMLLVMELLEGETLRARLGRGSCRPDEVIGIATHIALGLQAAHKEGIVHRDIKPANIFLASDGCTKLLDFGIAKHFGAAHSETVTQAGTTAGTVDYMSPEQLRAERLDQRSDLFAFGSLLYEMLVGVPPFRSSTQIETIARIIHQEVPALPARVPDRGWNYILRNLLAKEREDRYRDMSAFLRDLEGLRAAVPPQAAAPVRATRKSRPAIAVFPLIAARCADDAGKGVQSDLMYVCSGMEHELTVGLARLRRVRVIPRLLILRAQSSSGDLLAAGHAVHADVVLSGTVEGSGAVLAVTITMHDVASGRRIWHRRYEGAVEDFFAFRDRILRAVCRTLALPRPAPVAARTWRKGKRRSMYLCLKGAHFWRERYAGGLGTARQCFEEAIRRDPQSALSHAGRADTYSFLGLYSLMQPRSAWRIANRAVQKALRLDPTLAQAYTSQGLIRLEAKWDWEGAAASFERAIAQDHAQALPRVYLSWARVLQGRVHEALAAVEQALDSTVVPLSATVVAGAAFTYYLQREYATAIRHCEMALELEPNFLVALFVMGCCYAKQGYYAEAIQQFERATALSDGMPFYLGLLGLCYAEHGQRERALTVLRRLHDLEARIERGIEQRHTYVPPHCYVYIHSGLGNLTTAFEYQDKAFVDGASPFNYFAPIVDRLHGDPRFLEDIRKWRPDL
jgi:tetratricopeptide (TPR) repeat protein/tRNA A-37 threonylcarbamoyl transferase component Bud32